ncbi:DotU family type IV/VI secretion system protein [Xenophilus azovorans]|uniref:DotU family type IV/VI secretion system protein n=1 Tax=Xenophilus azovorans TaxID=151755 RepID=UPI00068C9759|nr:DotU family type IV/VI secretion system protein [Xenophilus azovorans]
MPPRLFRFCTPVFSFGLALDAARTGTPLELTGAEALQRARRLIERAAAAATAAGKPQEQVQSATFALAVWIDEVVQRHPPWADSAAPLQLQMFNSTNGPTEFFHHLAALPADDTELREVYWYVLALGFRGQYYFERDGGSGEPAKLLALHAPQLPVAPLLPQRLQAEPLTPQPYQLPDPPGPHEPQRRERALLRTGAALLVLVPALWWFTALLGPAGPATGSSRLAAPGPIERHLQGYACAELAVEEHAGTPPRVRGFVPTPADIQRVRDDLAALPEAAGADIRLEVRPWPYCEVVSVLRPYQARNRQARGGLRLAVPSAREGVLREGDAFVAEVRGPAFPSRLWVDYYTADGAVLHFRVDGSRFTDLAPGQSARFGADLPASWLVSPPFGTVLVTAVAAAPDVQEAGAEPPPFELAADYLLRLREMVSTRRPADTPVADWVFLQTRER